MFTKEVVHGDGDGSVLGFPTANFDIHPEEFKYEPGIYAAEVFVGEKKYHGALCAQQNPWKIEVHIIDYPGGDLYGTKVGFIVLDKVSEMEQCGSLHELKQKISDDVEKVRAYFAA